MRIAGHCRGTPARHHVVVPGMPTAIETARLAGRPPRPDDVPALVALYGTVEVAARRGARLRLRARRRALWPAAPALPPAPPGLSATPPRSGCPSTGRGRAP